MAGYPLACAARLGLGGRAGHMREAGLPLVFVGDLSGGAPLGRRPGVVIRCLITGDPAMRCDPEEGDLVVIVSDLGADLHCRDCKSLAGADGVCPHSLYGGRGVCKDRIAVAALLALI